MHGVRALSALVVDCKRVKAAKKNDANFVDAIYDNCYSSDINNNNKITSFAPKSLGEKQMT